MKNLRFLISAKYSIQRGYGQNIPNKGLTEGCLASKQKMPQDPDGFWGIF
jgi:hypothetical protein